VTTTYLDEIIAEHRRQAEADTRLIATLEEALSGAGAVRPFLGGLGARAVTRPEDLAVIAEVKRRSPAKGPLAPSLDPALLATLYEAGGARALSVLTDADFFGGSPEDLRIARLACGLPVLRKDFTVARRDCYDARIMGADALLLIVAALSNEELADLHAFAVSLGLAVLVEVHDEDELARALRVEPQLIGVNQRDLHSFAVDPERAVRVGAKIPEGIGRVAESGITSHEDMVRLADAGFHAVLVGERLVTADDPAVELRRLRRGDAHGTGDT
jgi:indole-3-glycerol phosphate synthase